MLGRQRDVFEQVRCERAAEKIITGNPGSNGENVLKQMNNNPFIQAFFGKNASENLKLNSDPF